MSYEGCEQVICKNGHYFAHDCYYHDELCPHCSAEVAWYNPVDQTNGPNQGEIPMSSLEQFIIEPEKTETCAHCGHTKIVSQAKYRIPTRNETDPLRIFVDEEAENEQYCGGCDENCDGCQVKADDES